MINVACVEPIQNLYTLSYYFIFISFGVPLHRMILLPTTVAGSSDSLEQCVHDCQLKPRQASAYLQQVGHYFLKQWIVFVCLLCVCSNFSCILLFALSLTLSIFFTMPSHQNLLIQSIGNRSISESLRSCDARMSRQGT